MISKLEEKQNKEFALWIKNRFEETLNKEKRRVKLMVDELDQVTEGKKIVITNINLLNNIR